MGAFDDHVNEQFDLMKDMAVDDAQKRRLQQGQNFYKDFSKRLGNAINEPAQPQQSSSGGSIAGKLLAGAAIAGGAFLLSKLFSSNDKDKSNSQNNNSNSIVDNNNNTKNDNSLNDLIEKANRGDTESMIELGYKYKWGQGVEESYNKMMEWWQKAANLGSSKAKKLIKVNEM